MDELDKYISDIVSKKIHEPPKYEATIRNALKDNKKFTTFNEVVRKIAITIISISTIGGMVFAGQMFKKFNQIVDEEKYTIENDEYIQNLNMEYKTIDNLSIKIDSILVDDFNIRLNLNYLYTEPITSTESKIVIKDENDNLIYYSGEVVDYYNNIFKAPSRDSLIIRDNIITESENIDENIEIDDITQKATFNYIEQEKKTNIKRIIDLYTDIDYRKFPESKKIYVELEDVILKNGNKTIKTIEGNWSFEIELDDKFLNRKTTNYLQENDDNVSNNFKVIKAEKSNILLKLKLEYNGKEDINKLIDTLDLSNIQIFDEKNNQYINANNFEIVNDKYIKVDYKINENMILDRIILNISNLDKITIVKYI